MSLVLQSSGGGSVTLQEAVTASNLTITVPAIAGTMALTSQIPVAGPAFSAYLGSAQTLSGSTWTKIQCNTEEFDTNSNYDTSNYRFTPTVAGYYQVTASLGVLTTQTGIGVSLYKNGSAFKQVQNTGSVSSSTSSGSALIYFNGSTDYVEMYGLVNTGQGIQTGVTITFFQAVMVRA